MENYAQNQFAQTNPFAGAAQYRQASYTGADYPETSPEPKDPMVERIQRMLGEIVGVVAATEHDLNAVSSKLFGERPEKGEAGGSNALPNGADEAIQHSLSFVAAMAYRVRNLAADLNGRI